MSHYPKLEVFKITLKPYKNFGETFKEFFYTKANIGKTIKKTDADTFKAFFKIFINEIDKDSFFIKNKKGFTTYDARDIKTSSIKASYTDNYLYGFAEGGDFGKKRSTSELSDKKKKTPLKETDIVMDRFFFLLYLKPDSQYGIFMVLSYSSGTITQLFTEFLGDLFKNADSYYKPEIIRYIPEIFKEKYKEESVLRKFRFETIMPAADLEIDSYGLEDDELIIKVEVTTKQRVPKNLIQKLYNKITNTKIGTVKLNEFTKRNVDVEDSKGQNDSFEIDKEFDPSPKIYLEGKVDLKLDGTPEDDSLLKYSLSLLEEIKLKIYPINNVQER